jgi:hypothetical protein
MKLMIPKTELSFAFRSFKLIAIRNARYVTYVNKRMSVVVSRGSQFQKEPHAKYAQSEPESKATTQKATPNFAEASAIVSHLKLFRIRYNTLPTDVTPNAKYEIQAEGT